MAVPLITPKAPNLLIAPEDYEKRYHEQMNNALRLYFNQIDNFAAQTIQTDNSQSVIAWFGV
jgi:hypothetical protein